MRMVSRRRVESDGARRLSWSGRDGMDKTIGTARRRQINPKTSCEVEIESEDIKETTSDMMIEQATS